MLLDEREIVLSIFVAGIVCVEKMIKVCDRE